MSHVDTLVAQAELHLSRKFQQSQEVGYRGTFFPDAFAESFLGQSVLVDELLECECDFNGVEVFALDILNERHLGELAVVGRAYICGH
ncbi:hypothetical protein IMSAG192_00914 [Muribaculaceae bacterium]|nr:hypothetical protein IMSAG192_00914 [Muribaculaceae bacterium]